MIQTTSYPESESTELKLEIPVPTEFTVYVRIPGWLQSPAQLSVNGKGTSVPAEPRTFAAIRRVGRNNATIQVGLPFSFRGEPIDDHHQNMVALLRGPLMLVALDPQLKLDGNLLNAPQGLTPIPCTAQAFEMKALPEEVRFVPFYTVGEQSYTTYLKQA